MANLHILTTRKGSIKLIRTHEFDVRSLIICPYCFMLRTTESKHLECHAESQVFELPCIINQHSVDFGLLLCTMIQKPDSHDERFQAVILDKMEALDVNLTEVIRSDPLILTIGWFMFKTSTSPEKQCDVIVHKLLSLGRVLEELRMGSRRSRHASYPTKTDRRGSKQASYPEKTDGRISRQASDTVQTRNRRSIHIDQYDEVKMGSLPMVDSEEMAHSVESIGNQTLLIKSKEIGKKRSLLGTDLNETLIEGSQRLAEFLNVSDLEGLLGAVMWAGSLVYGVEVGSGVCDEVYRLLLMCAQILRGHSVRHHQLHKNQVNITVSISVFLVFFWPSLA